MSLFDSVDTQPIVEPQDSGNSVTPEPEVNTETPDTGETTATPSDGGDDDGGGGDDGPKEPTDVDKKVQGILTSLKEERAERQRTQRELENLRSQLAQPIQPAPKPPSYEELDQKFYGGSPSEYIDQRLKEVEQLAETKRVQDKIAMSREMMRAQHADYDDVIAKFQNAAESNPALYAQMEAHPHPAQFAYENGRIYAEVADVGGLDGLKEKIKAEVRAEVIAEMKAKAGQEAAAGIVPSNAGARGSGTDGSGEPALGSPGQGMFE